MNDANTMIMLNQRQFLDMMKEAVSEEVTKVVASYKIVQQVNRLHEVRVTVSMIAEMYAKSEQTIRKYVRLGLIPQHKHSTDAKIFINGDVAFNLDFDKLRRESRAL